MKIQSVIGISNIFKNNHINFNQNQRLSFKAEIDTFESKEEKPLSIKEQNEKIVRSYHEDMLVEMGYFPKVLKNGKFQLMKYRTTDKENFLKSFSIREEDLFKSIEVISGDADLRRSKMTNIGSLKKVGGDLKISKSDIVDLSGLEEVKGDIYLNNKIKSIGDVKIGGVVYFNDNAKIDLNELRAKKIKFVKKVSK